jgi:hypothetical protein
MDKHKLVKSYTVTSRIQNSKKGEVLILKKHQGLIGISDQDLLYESEQTGSTFTKKTLMYDHNTKVKIKECFANLSEKFEYIS